MSRIGSKANIASERPSAVPSRDLRQEVVEGLLYTHARLKHATQTTLDASSFLYALVELLSEKGLISIDELDERKHEVAKRLTEKNNQAGVGVLLQDPEYDKYGYQDEADIDCASRIHLCKAACCRLPFALSKQDIREGIIQWDLGQPYVIAQGEDGYCTHLARESCLCNVREHRPVPCRGYDCRKNDKIWLDFERKTVNPEILRSDWPRCVSVDSPEPKPA